MEKPYIVCHMMTSVGAGIDGRGGMGSVFDGLPMDRGVTRLRLEDVKRYGSGAVWLRYSVEGVEGGTENEI